MHSLRFNNVILMAILQWQPSSLWSTAVLIVAIAIVGAAVGVGVGLVDSSLLGMTAKSLSGTSTLTSTQTAELLLSLVIGFIIECWVVSYLYK